MMQPHTAQGHTMQPLTRQGYIAQPLPAQGRMMRPLTRQRHVVQPLTRQGALCNQRRHVCVRKVWQDHSVDDVHEGLRCGGGDEGHTLHACGWKCGGRRGLRATTAAGAQGATLQQASGWLLHLAENLTG